MKTKEEMAEKFVNELVPKVYKALDEAQILYDEEMICHLLSDGFLGGYDSRDAEVEGIEAKLAKMKEVITDEDLGCADCIEAKADGYTLCGDCSCG